jgi:hypothetical protein
LPQERQAKLLGFQNLAFQRESLCYEAPSFLSHLEGLLGIVGQLLDRSGQRITIGGRN